MKSCWVIIPITFISLLATAALAKDSKEHHRNKRAIIKKLDRDYTVSSIRVNQHTDQSSFVHGQNTGSAYFRGRNRIRVLDNNPVNPNANPSAYIITGNTITVEAWVFPMSLPEHYNNYIIVSRPYFREEPWRAYELGIWNWGNTDDPRIWFGITDGNVPENLGMVLDTNEVAVGSWTHVAGTYDGTMVRLYINGELVAENPYTANIGRGNTGFYISGLGAWFQGLIDEVRLWNIARSQAEIQATMNTSLNGDEIGLVGYWPLDEATEVNGNWPVTIDLTANHNDLWVRGAVFLDATPGSEVSVAPELQIESLEGVVDEHFVFRPTVFGWPIPEISLASGPSGMTFNSETGTVNWTPATGQDGYHDFTLQATNSVGTVQGTYTIWVDLLPQDIAEHNNNNIDFSVFNNGIVGAHFGADSDEASLNPEEGDVGFQFNGLNGLYEGDLVIAQSENQVSGGLFIKEFGTQSSIDSIASSLFGFDQAFEARFNDQRAPNPIGVRVIQRSHSKSTSPDDDYVIMEYEIFNTSGSVLNGIYIGLAMDWDVGYFANNLGGYDATRKLSYMFEPGGENNSNYYGVAVLKGKVSGHTIWPSAGGESADSVLYNRMRTISELPTTPGDQRAIIAVGPYDIPTGDSIRAVFAILGGTDLADLQVNADAALAALQGGPGPTVRIEPPDTTVEVEESFTIDVIIDGATNLGSFQFDVNYLSRVTHVDSIWLGNFLGSTGRNVSLVGPVIDNVSDTGRVSFGAFSFGAAKGPDGSGVLARIKFTAQDTGVTALDLKKLQITDIGGMVQGVADVNDAVVRVIPRVLSLDPARTSVEANPDSLPADGISTSTITVTPKDSLGNNLGPGQMVTITTTAGTLLANVSDNGDGTYTQLLKSSTTPGTAVITATVNGREMSQKPQVVFTPLAGIAVRIEPSDTTVTVGDTFTIDVVVDSVQNLGSFQFDLEYKTSIIHANNAWLGYFLGSTGRNVAPVGPVIDNTSGIGKVTFGGFSFGAVNGPDGSGVLAKVQFTVQDTGSTTLNLMEVQLTDIDGQVQDLGAIGNGIVNGIITSVNTPFKKPIPTEFSLSQNYPNPFNPGTTIQFQLAKPEWVTIKIFNLLGQEIKTLVDQNMEAGYFTTNWNGRDESGREVPSGIYFYQIEAGNWIEVKKMILQK